MFDWTKITGNPSSTSATEHWADYYKSISRFVFLPELGTDHDKFIVDLLLSEAHGEPILDIGIAEHTIDHVESNKWFHRKLRVSAAPDQVWGQDINAQLVEYVRQRYGWHNLLAGDATETPVKDNFFGVIYAGQVLDHVSNVGNLLSCCWRALKPGGALVVSTANPHAWEFLKRMRRYGTVPGGFERTCFVTPSGINELARRTGFVFETSLYLCGRHRTKRAKLFGKLYFRYRDLIWYEHTWILRKTVVA